MADKQSPSSWDDLIKQIGAAPAPDALERKRPAIETKFDPPPAVDAAAVKPKPGDWNALAGELGIEAPPPTEPARKPPQKKPITPATMNPVPAQLITCAKRTAEFRLEA